MQTKIYLLSRGSQVLLHTPTRLTPEEFGVYLRAAKACGGMFCPFANTQAIPRKLRLMAQRILEKAGFVVFLTAPTPEYDAEGNMVTRDHPEFRNLIASYATVNSKE